MSKPLTILYDGACPLCSREVEWLRRHDHQARLGFEDVSAPSFDPGRFGLSRAEVMAVMHAVLPDGRVVRRIDAIRAIYQALGHGWLVATLGWPGMHWLFDRLYGLFARNRMRLGRLLGRDCNSEACGLHEGRDRTP